MKRKIVFAAVLAALCAAFLVFSPSAEESAPAVRISAPAPAIGREMTAVVSGISGDYTYLWEVSGETVSTDAHYTPTAADLETFIRLSVLDASGQVLASDEIFFSKLPVLYIDCATEAVDILREFDYDAHFLLSGNANYGIQYDAGGSIKGRGHGSWGNDKKPFKIKLEKKTDLFGFGKSKHYVLLADATDPSLLRNEVGYELSRVLGLTAPDSMYIEVVYNGEHLGVYQLVEHLRIGSSLVDIQNLEDAAAEAAKAIRKGNPDTLTKADDEALEDALCEDFSWLTEGTVTFRETTYRVSDFYELPPDIFGGFLLELGETTLEKPSSFETKGGLKVTVSDPETIETNPELFSRLQTLVNDFEEAIASPDGYNAKGVHYTDLCDLDSLVAYWLTEELLSNEDSASRSRYAYIDAGGKITFGPVWDFDIGGGSYDSFFGPKTLNLTGTVVGLVTGQDFFKNICSDPLFIAKTRALYFRVRPILTELVAEGGTIDRLSDYLYEAAVANETLWRKSGDCPRIFSGECGDLAFYKQFLTERFAWFEEVFATMESTLDTLVTSLAACPYRPCEKVTFRYAESLESDLWGAQINPEDSFSFFLFAPEGARVYVNGKLYKTYTKLALSAEITLPASVLDTAPGAVNVVSVVTESGERNFLTLAVAGTAAPLPAFRLPKGVTDLSDTPSDLAPIAARPATKTRYGLAACYYSAACDRYYADETGAVPLAKSEVIISSVSTSRVRWKHHYFTLLNALVVLIPTAALGIRCGVKIARRRKLRRLAR